MLNGFVERPSDRFSDKHLNHHTLRNLPAARRLIEEWDGYNAGRPHTSTGSSPPTDLQPGPAEAQNAEPNFGLGQDSKDNGHKTCAADLVANGGNIVSCTIRMSIE